MARPLIVEPNTERLHVVLMRDCATVDATNVTLTVTRKGKAVRLPVLDCAHVCTPSCPRAHDMAESRWGGCGGCGKRSPTLGPCHPGDGALLEVVPPPSKTYIAESVVRGVATFAIDHDLTAAPAGWYLGRVAVDGCNIAVLTIWLRCSAMISRSV